MTRAQGARSQTVLAFEDVYGTPPASGFIRVPFVSSDAGSDQPLLDNEVLGFGRDPLRPDRDAIDSDGTVVIPIDVENFGLWLKATFGQPETTGLTAATGSLTFAGQPAAGTLVLVNGVSFKAVASGATGNQFNIGGSLTATLAALVVVLNASAVAQVSVATYTSDATHLMASYDTLGAGNGFTMAIVAGELISIWDDMQDSDWNNNGATGATSVETFQNFVSAYQIGNSGAGTRYNLGAQATVGPGSTYHVRVWMKEGTSSGAKAEFRSSGGVTSRLQGPYNAPAITAQNAGLISNVVATELATAIWLWEFDITVGPGITQGMVGGGNSQASHTVILFGQSLTPKTEAGETILGGATSQHVFTSGSWDLPSFSLETQIPEVPKYAMLSGCVVDSLGWEMRRKGHLQATVKLVGQHEEIDVASAAGEIAELEYKRFSQFNGAVERDGSALSNVSQCRVSYMNNLDLIDGIRGDGEIEGADPSIAAAKIQITTRFANMDLHDQAVNGESCLIRAALVISATESFEVVFPAVYLPRVRTPISGPAGIEVTFDCQGAQTDDGGPMCICTLKNSVAAY